MVHVTMYEKWNTQQLIFCILKFSLLRADLEHSILSVRGHVWTLCE